ncbi:FadR/GntR family transcriptional regulator [Nitrogeniibacter aestuarii]|uniref:FadR/GntR family transcriptional regulator n=1 Tax=Nitrogeniibacter aestuarii TaxID=2815343 RepID=UPI001D11B9A9|nr:FCD domain-containing protein [Nitrogeniibacter aestuarii]
MQSIEPLARPSQLSETVSQTIEAWIREGQMPAGTRLPTEKMLASDFGVSRAVVREAISRLKADGLVTTRQGAGAFVSDRPSGSSFRLDAPEVDAAQALADIFELRYIVECAAAAMAARRRSDVDLAVMRAALSRMDEALVDWADATEADDAFHTAVAAATGNRAVGRFIRFMGGQFFESRVPTWARTGHAKGWARDSQEEHHRLFAAIAARDAQEARAAARAHLVRAASRLGVDASHWDEVPVGLDTLVPTGGDE